MKLSAYLSANDLTLQQFAARVGCSIGWLSRIVREIDLPRWPFMISTLKATDGAVTPNDFLRAKDRIYGKSKRRR